MRPLAHAVGLEPTDDFTRDRLKGDWGHLSPARAKWIFSEASRPDGIRTHDRVLPPELKRLAYWTNYRNRSTGF